MSACKHGESCLTCIKQTMMMLSQHSCVRNLLTCSRCIHRSASNGYNRDVGMVQITWSIISREPFPAADCGALLLARRSMHQLELHSPVTRYPGSMYPLVPMTSVVTCVLLPRGPSRAKPKSESLALKSCTADGTRIRK